MSVRPHGSRLIDHVLPLAIASGLGCTFALIAFAAGTGPSRARAIERAHAAELAALEVLEGRADCEVAP